MSVQQTNAGSIAEFCRYIARQKPELKTRYEQLLAEDLSKQQWHGCFQRNVLKVLEQAYAQALAQLQALPFDGSACAVERGFAGLTKPALAAFDGFVDEFLLLVVDRHRTSCALSNFPDEHKPDKTYLNQVKRDIAGLWQNFALDVNAHFLDCR